MERIHYYLTAAQKNTWLWGSTAEYVIIRINCIMLLRDIRSGVKDVRVMLAEYIGANKSDVVIVENTSDGVNSVIRSLNFKQNDTILQLSIAYGTFEEKQWSRLAKKSDFLFLSLPICRPSTRYDTLKA